MEIAQHFQRLELHKVQALEAHTLRQVNVLLPSICLVRCGTKQLIWDASSIAIQAGQWVLLPKGMKFEVRNVPDNGRYLAQVLSLTPALIEQFRVQQRAHLGEQPKLLCARDLLVPHHAMLAQTWEQLSRSLEDDTPQALQEHHASGVLLALSLLGKIAPLLLNRADPLSERIQLLFALNPARAWTTTMAAQSLHMGASTLRRHLHKEGCNFAQLLRETRLSHSLGLLQATDTAIADIARASGYASASRFSCRFRAHYGIAPSELRRTM